MTSCPKDFPWKGGGGWGLRGCLSQEKIDKIPTQRTVSIITSFVISYTDERTKCYQITTAYYPVCPMTEPYRDALFTYTENAMTIFILQATTSIYSAGEKITESNVGTESLSNLVTSSKERP